MKLCLVVPAFPKTSETFIANKFHGLLERGWDVFIVCSSSNEQDWVNFPQLKSSKVRSRVRANWPHQPRILAALLIPLNLLRYILIAPARTVNYLHLGWKHFGVDILRRLYLDAEILLIGPDLLHFEYGPLMLGRSYLKDLLPIKIITSFRGYDLNFSGLDKPDYYQEVWQHADALHLLGEDLWQRALSRGCPVNKPHVLIPPAIDTVFFQRDTEKIQETILGSQERPLRILSVGRLEWKKGYEFSLQAVKLLMDQGIHCEYRIIGWGDFIEAVAFARHQLGLEKTVQLLGAQSKATVKENLQWADVFLHLAVSEGFCNAVLEAQAMQLPVVCSDADGLRENVADGKSGFVVKRRDPLAAAEKLHLLAINPTLRQRMGQSGRERVIKSFQLEDQITMFEDFYIQVLQK